MPVLRTVAIVVLAIAVGVKVVNPILDKLILPADDEKKKKLLADVESFDPNQTDVMGYTELGFVKPEVEHLDMNIGVSFILSQSAPKWLTYLLDTYTSAGDYKKNLNEDKYEKHNVDILDARKLNLEFDKAGFTLLQMDEPSKTGNWRKAGDVAHFQEEIRPELMKLFPGASRIEFTSNVVRGGSRLGDQPASINGPHLDYSQDDAARTAFHETYPVNPMVKEHLALMGDWDTAEDEMKTLIGIWKPIHMKGQPVYDFPLALMDASTFQRKDERPHRLHINFLVFLLHNLNAGFAYDANQKWYYYPYQTEEEVLVFTQYSKDKHFCNPHTSFEAPNRPNEYETRQSIEMRAAVFYPKDGKYQSLGTSV
ncbi:MAG: hypothetical protein SGARI_001326 [Bacillariaceae sp.]